MYNITLISTVHKEIGKCNADELCDIIRKINPEVVFLEALEGTYSNYDNLAFSSFGVYHNKLEVKALQKYCRDKTFAYVPVLDNGMPETFEKKYSIVCENKKLQNLIARFNSLTQEFGFQFLNSVESIDLHEEMRMLESHILNNNEVDEAANRDIDAYENSMIRNIYSYSKNNKFDTAIFMCGSAHRKSIIEKIAKYNALEEAELSWIIF